MAGTSARLLSLLSLLQARRDWPGQLLAERLAISDRTVRRDVDRLRELGYPIHATKGPAGGYRLEAGSDLPPLLFDDDQAVALAIALRIAAASGSGIGEAATRALATVRQLMPSRLRARIDTLEVSAVRGPSGSAATTDPETLVALATAVRAREIVRFVYTRWAHEGTAPTEPGPARRVEPHHVVSRAGRWYLVGWDVDRGDWRTFRIDRLAVRTPNGPRFVPRELPDGVGVAAFMSARFKGSAGGDQWPCIGKVVLDLPAGEVAPYVGDGLLEPVGGGRCRLVIGSWSWAALVAQLGRFDTDMEVVSPPELRAEFARISKRFARAGAAATAP